MREDTRVWEEAQRQKMVDEWGEFRLLDIDFTTQIPFTQCPKCKKRFTIMGIEEQKDNPNHFYYDVPGNFPEDELIDLFCPYCSERLLTKSNNSPDKSGNDGIKG